MNILRTVCVSCLAGPIIFYHAAYSSIVGRPLLEEELAACQGYVYQTQLFCMVKLVATL